MLAQCIDTKDNGEKLCELTMTNVTEVTNCFYIIATLNVQTKLCFTLSHKVQCKRQGSGLREHNGESYRKWKLGYE